MKIKRKNRVKSILRTGELVILLVAILLFVGGHAPDSRAVVPKLLVGTMEVPPFAMKTADGRWEGLGIELWQAVAQDLRIEFELQEYTKAGEAIEALKKGELIAFPAMAVTESYEAILDLSHSYLRSGLAIAVPTDITGSSFFDFAGHFIDRFVSLDFFLFIGSLLMLSLGAGALVWLFERGRNREMFGGGVVKGLGQGIWWAMVTMTTVGYGDKAPKTIGGRSVALIWMFSSIILVASFTAAITASLTVDGLSGKVRGLSDLDRVRVGSVAHSESLNFLTRRGIVVRPFTSSHDGLRAIVDKEIDAFVHNELVLKYLASKEFAGRMKVLPATFNRYFVSIGLPQDSPLLEPVNRTLLKIIDTDDWLRLLDIYIGPGH